MDGCSYTTTYRDYKSGRYQPYKCDNEQYSQTVCKFHHREYAADDKNKEELTEPAGLPTVVLLSDIAEHV
jgi:hypothetical protein